MAMTHTSPEVQELLKLLQDKFDLPQGCTEFTLSCSTDELVQISTTYLPRGEASA